MRRKIYNLDEINLLKGREIFVDANVLIYLFWSSGKKEWERNYAKAFQNLLEQKNKLFVDFLVISEIINRTIRIEYQKHLSQQGKSSNDLTFKDFRNNKEGQEALEDIYIIVQKEILNNFHFFSKSFKQQDVVHFLEVDTLDFVDKAIVQICSENDYVLLTNDSDFRNTEIDLLTCNTKILN